jgi:uncharacterized protein (DUF1697 family)
MYTHVVLLRGVNVGKAKKVPMASFKRLLHKLGCDEVVTLLNSGNAVVSVSGASAVKFVATIADALRTTFGFEVPAIVSPVRDFRAIVHGNTLFSAAMNPSRFLVVFAGTSEALRRLKEIPEGLISPELFLLGRKAAYLYCPDGISQSETAKFILGRLGSDVTTRNWATVLKLSALSTGRAA